MYVSRKVESIAPANEGREWVEINDFLNCFPGASEIAQQQFKMVMRMMSDDYVEKRIHESLFQGLQDKCLSVSGQNSLYAPTVTKDGWVFWTDGYHTQLLNALAALYIKEDYANDWEFFAANAGWSISTMDCKSIMIPREYRPNKEDKEIFEFFNVVKMRW